MSFGIFDTRTLLGVINQGNFGAKTYLRDRYFKNVKLFPTSKVDFDIRDKAGRKLAPFVHPKLGGKVVTRNGFQTESYETPLVSPETITEAEEFLKRSPGETIYGGKTPLQRATEAAQDDMIMLENMITRREEAMCSSALFTGKVDVKGDGYDDTLDFWDGLEESEKPTSVSATKWTEDSVDGAAIAQELRTLRRSRIKNGGYTPTEILCGTNVIDVLIDKLTKGDLLDNRRVQMGQIDPQHLPQGVTYWGYLKDSALDIYSYDEWYEDDNGDLVPMVPVNKILMGSPNVQTSMAYGSICIADKVKNTMDWYSARRVPVSYIQERPAGRVIQLNARPMPIIHQVQGFHVLQPID